MNDSNRPDGTERNDAQTPVEPEVDVNLNANGNIGPDTRQTPVSPSEEPNAALKTGRRSKWLIPAIAGILAITIAGFFLLKPYLFPAAPSPSSTPSEIAGQTPTEAPSSPAAATEAPRFNVIALADSATGVAPDTTFQLSLPKGVNRSLLEKTLRIQPTFGFKLEQLGADVFLTPNQPLAQGQVYRFDLDIPDAGISESFAFQTRLDFRVDSTLPANQGTGVPVNTGVEIRFSQADFAGVSQLFELVPLQAGVAGPAVPGRWENRGDTAAFVPAQELAPGTMYQATLKAGVTQSGSEQKIGQDTVFLFQTAMEKGPLENKRLYLAETLHGFTSRQVPVLPVYCDDETAGADWQVTIWRYPNANLFKTALSTEYASPWWIERELARVPDTDDLIQQASLTTQLLREDYENRLVLPDSLPEGWYVVSCRAGDLADYAFVQIQDMSLYLSVAESNTLAWAHDGVTRKALSGVSLRTDAGPSATTDAKGTALLSGTIYSPDGKPLADEPPLASWGTDPLFLSAFRPGRSELVIPIAGPDAGYRYGYRYEYGYWGSDEYQELQYRNWHYLFTDRSVYLPTDEMSFWGVVQPREGGSPPSSLTVSLVRNDGWSNEEGWVMQTQTVVPGAGGVYTGNFSISTFETGAYSLVVRDGDKVTDRNYLSVSQYDKPVYVLTADVEQLVRMPGESVSISLSGRFFEGTPVPGLAFDTFIHYDSQTIGEKTVQLDGAGMAKISALVPDLTGELSWRPRGGWFEAVARDPEEGENSQYASFIVFPRDAMAWLTATVNKDQLSFSVHTHRLDKDAARELELHQYEEDPANLVYLGDTLDQPFTIALFEHYWDKRVIGKGYDPINKLTYDRYDYFEVDRQIAEYSGTTAQGLFEKKISIPGWKDDRAYRLELRCADESGRPIMEMLYPEGTWSGYQYGYGAEDYYELRTTKREGGYRVGESVSLEVARDGKVAQPVDTNGGFLYLLARDGHLSWETGTSGTWQFPFQEEWIPNLNAKAVIWTETGIRETNVITIPYDRTEKALQVSVETDAQAYRPGQEVQVDVQVRDAAGNPAQADVNLAVVDEAYFALYPQEVDPLGALYEPVYSSGILYSVTTNKADTPPQQGGGAEGGEGDDAGTPIRKAFRDTAWFGNLKTDASGMGQASFVLPDNLTTFRITAQAATAALQAGHATGQAISKLPFFVQPVLQSVFLEGDAPSLLLRSYGDGLTQPETSYAVSLVTGTGEKREWNVSGVAQSYLSVPLGALPEGTAVVTIKATNGALTDAVERTLHVEKSLLTTMQTLTFPIASGEGIPQEVLQAYPGNGSAVLTVANRQGGLVAQVLWQLYGASGLRVDRVMGRQLAAEALRDVYQEPSVTEIPSEDFSLWQQADGGIALLPYGASDTLLSAKLCSVAADRFDRQELRRYFKYVSSDETAVPERAAAALWGQAALGDPVLLQIRSLLAEAGWEDEEKLIFGLALADLGDRGGAGDVLDSLLEKYGRAAAPLRWLELGKEREDMLRNTALTAMLAQKTGRLESENLFRYVLENESRRVPLPLEKISLVQSRMVPTVAEASASVFVDGEKQQVSLSAGENERFHLFADQLAAVRFEDLNGELEGMVTSRVGTDGLPASGSGIVSIERAYIADGSRTTEINATDAVEVVLTVTFSESAPKGGYSLSDLLPAGLRFTGGLYTNGEEWCWWQPDGREVRTALYHRGGAKVRTLRYRARAAGAGTFSAEAPVVRHDDSDAGGVGVEETVTVKAP